MVAKRTAVMASIVCFAAALVAGAQNVTEFYVSPTGNDISFGTKEAPFRTFEKACEVVGSMNKDMTADIVVYLAGGLYPINRTVLLQANDSGSNGHRIIYKAAPGATPVISGGKMVTGWTRDTGNRWMAPAPGDIFRQLYVNGVRAKRARGPAPQGMGRYGDLAFIDADAGHTAAGEAMADWGNQGDIELGYYNSWSHMICKVKSITRDGAGGVKIAMQQPEFFLVSRKEGVQAKLPDYIENAFELLDEPGEWYFDKSTHVVYYIPREGENMQTATVVVPLREQLLLLGSVQNVGFEGITFADATWFDPNSHGHADVQGNFSIRRDNLFTRDNVVVTVHNEYHKSPASIVLLATKSVHFERCTFTRLGSAAINLEQGAQENVISGCRFYDISGSAIQVGDVKSEDHHPHDERMIVKNNQVVNNYIHNIGVEFQDSVGVFGGYVNGTVIAHNEICQLPYSGISVGWGWGEEDAGGGNYPVIPFKYANPTPCGNNRIEDNHIHHVMLQRNDGGGIYTLGNQPGTVIKGNHIHDNNVGGGPGGIYLDEGSGFIEITGNAVYNVPTAMNYNNKAQNRTATCNEHDNFFNVKPGEGGFPQAVEDGAGLEAGYRDLLKK